jgi:NAD(P)-dependent dehydrogenase (short-subunit alcohol dehydrogenase family)
MDLAGRAALVTGGRRLGAAVALELARRGAAVALTYHHSRAGAAETLAAIQALGARGEAIAADLSAPEACARVVNQAAEAFGRLDILVHMASVYRPRALADLTLADWEAPLAVDLRAAFLCAQAAVPHMRAAGGGRIVLFADWVAASGRPRYRGYVPYYVAKAGVIALTEALALELAGDGILVNAVAPGPILPPPELDPAEAAAVVRETPLARWGGEPAIVNAVAFLVESDFVTGETLRVDGGRHLL